MGCCALAAVVTPRVIVVANAGDCRAVLGRKSGPFTEGGADEGGAAASSSYDAGSSSVGAGGSSSLPSAALTVDARAAVEAEMDAELAAVAAQRRGEALSPVFGGSNSGISSSNSGGGGVSASAAGSHQQRSRVQTVPLSEDHNARMPREQVRLLHPQEPDVVHQKVSVLRGHGSVLMRVVRRVLETDFSVLTPHPPPSPSHSPAASQWCVVREAAPTAHARPGRRILEAFRVQRAAGQPRCRPAHPPAVHAPVHPIQAGNPGAYAGAGERRRRRRRVPYPGV